MGTLRIAAQPAELVRLRSRVGDAATEFGLDAGGCRDFVFAANEAVTNAIRHGTPDADGTILVKITADGDRLTLTVSDCGPFVTEVSNGGPMAESGRGFGLMATLVDEIQLSISRRHTTLSLSKCRVATD